MTPPLASPPVRFNCDRWLSSRLLALVLLVAAADGLLFDRLWGGLPVSLMLSALVGAALVFNRNRSDPTRRRIAIGLGLAALVVLIETGDGLAITFAFGAAGAIVLLIAAPAMAWEQLVLRSARLPFVGWARLPADIGRAGRVRRRCGRERHGLLGWAMPVVLSLVFVAIFAQANPFVEMIVRSFDLRLLVAEIGLFRLCFWALAISVIWPFLRLWRSARPASVGRTDRSVRVETGGLLGSAAIVRSLVAFNLIFALQTVTDIGYLTGGMRLPFRMTLAEFAHRGAYPLMAAALVAAGFVLLALRDGMEDLDRRLRGLLILFVAQGLLLVVSSILRLELYVEAYLLTQWRLAAFAWMGLVAFGFATILVRIFGRRSNRWLKNVNAGAFIVALWGWSMVDDVSIIARWNLSHISRSDPWMARFDMSYLRHFGVRIVPALDAHLSDLEDLKAKRGDEVTSDLQMRWSQMSELRDWRNTVTRKHLDSRRGWRDWSFSGWRLDRYLSTMPEWPAPAAR